jgi:hypothetical protein
MVLLVLTKLADTLVFGNKTLAMLLFVVQQGLVKLLFVVNKAFFW